MDSYTSVFGLWSVSPVWLGEHLSQLYSLVSAPPRTVPTEPPAIQSRDFGEEERLVVDPAGVAHISLIGPMLKRAGWLAQLFGYTGTEQVTQAVDDAGKREDVKGVAIYAESPGGHVGGVLELNKAVKRAADLKPVVSFVDELAASAAYWGIAPSTEIIAGPTAEVGSIGTMMVVYDVSRAMAEAGIDVKVYSTGAFKGAGVPGAPVTEDQDAYFQERVDDTNKFFLSAVSAGRRLTGDQLKEPSDGRVFMAQKAKALGLIDAVGTKEDAARRLQRLIKGGGAERLRSQRAELHTFYTQQGTENNAIHN